MNDTDKGGNVGKVRDAVKVLRADLKAIEHSAGRLRAEGTALPERLRDTIVDLIGSTRSALVQLDIIEDNTRPSQ